MESCMSMKRNSFYQLRLCAWAEITAAVAVSFYLHRRLQRRLHRQNIPVIHAYLRLLSSLVVTTFHPTFLRCFL